MMNFLEAVAKDIIAKYGTNLADIAIVFPNKRAALFMNEYLARIANKPIWSPSYLTISDLFYRNTDLVVGDQIKLVCDLHRSFTECTGLDETLDHFFNWGQLLLSDFDDVDKNMAEASKVFANIQNLHELDDISYLSEQQKEIIKKFFINFKDNHNSELKQRFLNLWSKLEDIYNNFNARLKQQGISYEGAIYREVIEQKNIDLPHKHYLFVGFNLLQKVEQELFNIIKKKGKAQFYWDFDKYYTTNNQQEAGYYIKQYLSIYPNELDNSDDSIYNCFKNEKDITYISATTNNIQARNIADWLQQNDRIKAGKDTVIVLCDETLLPTVLHCLPEEVDKVNITMGFPLQQTHISSLVKSLITLQLIGKINNEDRFRLKYVDEILNHPYCHYISEKNKELYSNLHKKHNYYPTSEELQIDDCLAKVFSSPANIHETHFASLVDWIIEIVELIGNNTKEANDPLLKESVFRMFTLLNRVSSLIKSNDLVVDLVTLKGVIDQFIQSTTIPFHGEPIEGIQIMGVLETRNLDFKHILMISCNEGNMPKSIHDSSFIPYSIRKAYNLTIIDHKIAIFAYYFYRLIQRAQDITISYNSGTAFGQNSEMSRFMIQLMVESKHSIKRQSLLTNQYLEPTQNKCISKSKEIMNILNGIEKISPSAINEYLKCPFKFYYSKILGIREPEIEQEGALDNRTYGNVYHRSAELIYQKIMDKNNVVSKESIEKIRKSRVTIELCVDEAFSELVFKTTSSKYRPKYNGLQLVNRESIINYLIKMLQQDEKSAPITIKGLELRINSEISFISNNEKRSLIIKGFIDRLDEVCYESEGRMIRVIDYKTGRPSLKQPKDIEDVFNRTKIHETKADYYLQTMLYSNVVRDNIELNKEQLPVSPCLVYIQNIGSETNKIHLELKNEPIYDIKPYQIDFMANLQGVLGEIFNSEIPFTATQDTYWCKYCPYSKLCIEKRQQQEQPSQ